MTEVIKLNDKEYVPKEELDALRLELERVERERVILEPANVMAMGKVQNLDKKETPLHLLFDFPHTEGLKVMQDILQNEVIEVWKDGERWGRYSREYWDHAKKVINAWAGGERPKVAVQANKDHPVLIYADDLGFVLAPRIESEDAA